MRDIEQESSRLRKTLSGESVLWSWLIAIGSLLLALRFAFLDFDGHHDGLMATAAVAIRDGARVHSDVFAQYGPVVPWIQGFAAQLVDQPVVAIRALNSVAIAVIAFAVAELGRKAPDSWPVTTSASRWAAISWVVLADFFYWVPMHPWSSTIAVAMAAAALLLILRGMKAAEQARQRASLILCGTAGFLVGLLPFTRLTIGVALIAGLAVYSTLAFRWLPGLRRQLAVGFGGASLAMLIVLGILLAQQSLVDYWAQAIIWPLSWSQNPGDQPDVSLLIRGMGPLWVSAIGASVVVLFANRGRPGPMARPLWVGAVSVLSGIWLVLDLAFNWRDWTAVFIAQAGWPDPLSESVRFFNGRLLIFLITLGLAVAVIRLVATGMSVLRARTTRISLANWFLLAVFAAATAIQVFPITDSRHLWWGLPILLALTFGAFTRHSAWSPGRNPVIIAVVVAAVGSLLAGYRYLAVERVLVPQGNLASGIYVLPEVAASLRESADLLKAATPSQDSIFLVKDGYLAGYDGQFHSMDAYFVNWGPSDISPPPLTSLPSVEATLVTGAPPDSSLGSVGGGTGRGLVIWPQNYKSQGPTTVISIPPRRGNSEACAGATIEFTWESVNILLSGAGDSGPTTQHSFPLWGIQDANLILNPSGTVMTWTVDGLVQTWELPTPTCLFMGQATVEAPSRQAVSVGVWELADLLTPDGKLHRFADAKAVVIDDGSSGAWTPVLTALDFTLDESAGLVRTFPRAAIR